MNNTEVRTSSPQIRYIMIAAVRKILRHFFIRQNSKQPTTIQQKMKIKQKILAKPIYKGCAFSLS